MPYIPTGNLNGPSIRRDVGAGPLNAAIRTLACEMIACRMEPRRMQKDCIDQEGIEEWPRRKRSNTVHKAITTGVIYMQNAQTFRSMICCRQRGRRTHPREANPRNKDPSTITTHSQLIADWHFTSKQPIRSAENTGRPYLLWERHKQWPPP